MVRRSQQLTGLPEALVVQLSVGQLRDLVANVVAEALADHEPEQQPALLTTAQLAQKIGCSVRTVARLRDAGLPVVYVLESPRFRLDAVLEFLTSNSAQLRDHGQLPMADSSQDATKLAELTLVTTHDVNRREVAGEGGRS